MKAVGAVAAGRNRKVHMKTVGVTIYCDEGSMGSNPALPQKEGGSKVRLALFLFVPLMESGSKYSILKEENFLSGHPLFYIQPILIAISLDIISCLK